MKLIIPCILLCAISQANRLLQSTGCETFKCSDGPCFDNPYTSNPRCCPTDAICSYEDYNDKTMVLCGDGNVYDNKCFGYCAFNKPSTCKPICECNSDTDCKSGYQCLETPFGFAGCDQTISDSCFGFCVSKTNQCGSDTMSVCKSYEQCLGNSYCGSLPSKCIEPVMCTMDAKKCPDGSFVGRVPPNCQFKECPPLPNYCGGYDNCQLFYDGCNNCDCGSDGFGWPLRCEERECHPTTIGKTRCVNCVEGYKQNIETGTCDVCKDDTQKCPDGSFVNRDPLNKCQFKKCPKVLPVETCATFKCEPGQNCYDTSKGPYCCAPGLCEGGPPCGGIGNDKCKPSYECVVNPLAPCELAQADCSGVCFFPRTEPPKLSCEVIDCKGNDVCYELGIGPICCDPNICVAGTCNNIEGQPKCDFGYECSYNNRVCVNPNAKPICGGFENCLSYNNGCNDCICGENGKDICPLKFCPPTLIRPKPKCTKCKHGYEVNKEGKCVKAMICATNAKRCPDGSFVSRDRFNNCKFKECPIIEAPVQRRCGGNGLVDCDNGYYCVANPNCPQGMTDCPGICVKQTDIIIPPIPFQRICGGFENCAAYNNGCNNCRCGPNGMDACTRRGCPPPQLKPDPKCIKCKDGYELNGVNECVAIPGCGGIDYCRVYTLGCNDCYCSDPFNPFSTKCTLQKCENIDLWKKECKKCMYGYELNPITKRCYKKPEEEEKCCKSSERPDMCWEGIQCCPNGEWSCSIGDGKRYGCGDKLLVFGEDKFGKVCNDNTLPPGCASILCPIGTSCCDNGIGGVTCCKTDECPKGLCKDPKGICAPLANCFANPCEMTTCTGHGKVTCEVNYCGGCYSIWKDAKGNVIPFEKCNPEPEPEKCCAASDWPGLCWEGIACCPNGKWSCSWGDGTYKCDHKTLKLGQDKFGKQCTDECPKGQCLDATNTCADLTVCLQDPCQAEICDIAHTCDVNYCGGCNAIFKDVIGNILTKEDCSTVSTGPMDK